MPLDVNVEKWIETLPKDVFKPKNVEEFRRYMDEGVKLIMGFSPKIEMKEIYKIEINGTETKIPSYIYIPKNVQTDGTLVYFHGGGFIWGSSLSYDNILRYLANYCNCKVASIDYRLAPEHKFPAAVIDAFDSIKYFYETDKKIAIAGDSAGGNLAAVVSILSRDEGIKLNAQALIYPTVGNDIFSQSMREYSNIFLTRDSMRFFSSMYLSNQKDILDFRFSPILAKDHKNLPPALIITAEYDPLRDQGESYASILNTSNVETVQIRFGGVTHGFISLLGLIPSAEVALQIVSSFIKSRFNK
ncbi:MAG: alpha/beta hydrolase [Caldisphaera sp.]|uniref:alpha/beta hydrolase n=1 Tax=Caldisphaera sp. TaxID=2060322 RepID=UPI000CB27306|nr:MAG: alpha/beta hydrolase [Caldisphaera sp.]